MRTPGSPAEGNARTAEAAGNPQMEEEVKEAVVAELSEEETV